MSDSTENDDATPQDEQGKLLHDERLLSEIERTLLAREKVGDIYVLWLFSTLRTSRSDNEALRSRLVELERAHDALRQDAERLDWLESHGELAIYFVKTGEQINTGMQSLRVTIDVETGATHGR